MILTYTAFIYFSQIVGLIIMFQFHYIFSFKLIVLMINVVISRAVRFKLTFIDSSKLDINTTIVIVNINI